MTNREKKYCDLRAKKCLAQMDDWWRRHRLYFTICVCKNKCEILVEKYIKFRECNSDSPLWYFRSFLKGFRLKLILVLTASMVISELPFVVQLFKSKFDLLSVDLINCLFLALPALIGMVFLDYILENLGKTVLLMAILGLAFLGAFGWYYRYIDMSLKGMYVVTGLITFMVWCVKARDPKVMRDNDTTRNSSDVLPKDDGAQSVQDVLPSKWQGKRVVTERAKG